ncbi:MAG: electron transfer flavoprotein subunit alpha/FixB family protein [Clostridia bacterium]|nr:electron transfer flavoprotein subunit alpha/FixB family protein [Clostridia bacterium]
MNKSIFVFCEQRDGELKNVSLELIGAATALAKTCPHEICAVLAGHEVETLAQTLIEHGANKVYLADDENLKHYLTEQYAQAVHHIITAYSPDIVLFPATSIGRDLAPRLSARLHTGLTADCTKLDVDESGSLFMTRPAFGGNLFATIVCPNHRPQMSTVRPGVMQKNAPDSTRSGEVIKVSVPFDNTRFAVELIEERVEKTAEKPIEEAKLLISVGRGMQKNIQQVKAFADFIGAEVSCSRAVVDDGALPQSRQVGQTGKTVRPQLYMALGISGAVQHLAGMGDSEFIVAVNKDKNATIFGVAHLGVVGDAAEILPYLEAEIRAQKA